MFVLRLFLCTFDLLFRNRRVLALIYGRDMLWSLCIQVMTSTFVCFNIIDRGCVRSCCGTVAAALAAAIICAKCLVRLCWAGRLRWLRCGWLGEINGRRPILLKPMFQWRRYNDEAMITFIVAIPIDWIMQ